MTDVPLRFPEVPLLWTVPGVYSPAERAAFAARIEAGEPEQATNNTIRLTYAER
ncbi:MAG: hypothetical protein KDD82_00630 [Planctomycetes bacterium]|nr:hypothetical protein [Planctomycetota bacterium]